MKQIQFTKGCPNNCEYCYEQKEMEYLFPDISEVKELQVLDMNFLANPSCITILKALPKAQYELICGVDFRRLTPKICDLMKEKGFIKVRWAWDYSFNEQKKHQKVWRMFKKAGFQSEELSVFVLTNWRVPLSECLAKLKLLLAWNVKVNDCCFDGGYHIKDEKDYNKNQVPKIWAYKELKYFRNECRENNLIVRFKIKPKLKTDYMQPLPIIFNQRNSMKINKI